MFKDTTTAPADSITITTDWRDNPKQKAAIDALGDAWLEQGAPGIRRFGLPATEGGTRKDYHVDLIDGPATVSFAGDVTLDYDATHEQWTVAQIKSEKRTLDLDCFDLETFFDNEQVDSVNSIFGTPTQDYRLLLAIIDKQKAIHEQNNHPTPNTVNLQGSTDDTDVIYCVELDGLQYEVTFKQSATFMMYEGGNWFVSSQQQIPTQVAQAAQTVDRSSAYIPIDEISLSTSSQHGTVYDAWPTHENDTSPLLGQKPQMNFWDKLVETVSSLWRSLKARYQDLTSKPIPTSQAAAPQTHVESKGKLAPLSQSPQISAAKPTPLADGVVDIDLKSLNTLSEFETALVIAMLEDPTKNKWLKSREDKKVIHHVQLGGQTYQVSLSDTVSRWGDRFMMPTTLSEFETLTDRFGETTPTTKNFAAGNTGNVKGALEFKISESDGAKSLKIHAQPFSLKTQAVGSPEDAAEFAKEQDKMFRATQALQKHQTTLGVPAEFQITDHTLKMMAASPDNRAINPFAGMPLDAFLEKHGGTLTTEQRMLLVQTILTNYQALQSEGVFLAHYDLAPRNILVVYPNDDVTQTPVVTIIDYDRSIDAEDYDELQASRETFYERYVVAPLDVSAPERILKNSGPIAHVEEHEMKKHDVFPLAGVIDLVFGGRAMENRQATLSDAIATLKDETASDADRNTANVSFFSSLGFPIDVDAYQLSASQTTALQTLLEHMAAEDPEARYDIAQTIAAFNSIVQAAAQDSAVPDYAAVHADMGDVFAYQSVPASASETPIQTSFDYNDYEAFKRSQMADTLYDEPEFLGLKSTMSAMYQRADEFTLRQALHTREFTDEQRAVIVDRLLQTYQSMQSKELFLLHQNLNPDNILIAYPNQDYDTQPIILFRQFDRAIDHQYYGEMQQAQTGFSSEAPLISTAPEWLEAAMSGAAVTETFSPDQLKRQDGFALAGVIDYIYGGNASEMRLAQIHQMFDALRSGNVSVEIQGPQILQTYQYNFSHVSDDGLRGFLEALSAPLAARMSVLEAVDRFAAVRESLARNADDAAYHGLPITASMM
jgi:hypothetical protein